MRVIPVINQLLKESVRRKWSTKEEQTLWYEKLALVRNRKLIRCSESQNHRCAYCGRKTWIKCPGEDDSPRRMASFEHVVPRNEGRTDSMMNLIMPCWRCNQQRGSDFTAEKF